MTTYGFLYFFVHDGLVHNRWPWRMMPRGAYLRRLVQAQMNEPCAEREIGREYRQRGDAHARTALLEPQRHEFDEEGLPSPGPR